MKNYEVYLYHITEKINSFFEDQKPYIYCKKGCSMCCEKGEYPWSNIEYQYLMKGYEKLSFDLKEKIKNEILKLKEEKKNFKGERFMHKCPFLIDGVCCVYEYRGIICRSFGLLSENEKTGNIQMPFCHEMGLNYAEIYDKETNSISNELYEKGHFEVPPKMYNVSYKFLTNDDFAKGYGFEFGEKKPLLDWL